MQKLLHALQAVNENWNTEDKRTVTFYDQGLPDNQKRTVTFADNKRTVSSLSSNNKKTISFVPRSNKRTVTSTGDLDSQRSKRSATSLPNKKRTVTFWGDGKDSPDSKRTVTFAEFKKRVRSVPHGLMSGKEIENIKRTVTKKQTILPAENKRTVTKKEMFPSAENKPTVTFVDHMMPADQSGFPPILPNQKRTVTFHGNGFHGNTDELLKHFAGRQDKRTVTFHDADPLNLYKRGYMKAKRTIT